MRENARMTSAHTALPSGTVTFLFTDIEGSTKLLNELGTDRFHDVLAVHTRLLRDAFQDGGHEVRIEGDALFVVFPVAGKAVRAAAAAQRALGTTAFPHGATVRVRMGMHTGEATPASAEAGADYVGIDVHRAARVAAAGHGGQVLLTEATATLARADLGDGLSLRDLGEFRLKDLARPERVYQLVIGGGPADFPPLRSLDRPLRWWATFSARARPSRSSPRAARRCASRASRSIRCRRSSSSTPSVFRRSTSWPNRTLCACSSSGRWPSAPTSVSPPRTRRRLPRSVTGSTASRSRSSSPRRV